MQLNGQNYLDGCWCDSESARTYGVQDPADLRREVSRYPLSTAAEVSRAVEGAWRAFTDWRRTSIAERARVLRRAAALMREWRDEIAATITAENGKLLAESLTEIDAAALELDFQIGEGERALPWKQRRILRARSWRWAERTRWSCCAMRISNAHCISWSTPKWA
ncbi:MAG: aldehyde dehydrogenase family protein [Steroidobacteraceae bacterium]